MDTQSMINVVFSSSLQELKENEELRTFYLQNAANFTELIENSDQHKKLSKKYYKITDPEKILDFGEESSEYLDFHNKLNQYLHFISPRLSKDHHDFVKQTFMSSYPEDLKNDQKFKKVCLSNNFGFDPVFEFLSEVLEEEFCNFQKSGIVNPSKKQCEEEIFKISAQEYKKLIDYLDFILNEINSEQIKEVLTNFLKFEGKFIICKDFSFFKMIPESLRMKFSSAFLPF